MIIGIDLGTTNTVVCYLENNEPKFLDFGKTGTGTGNRMLPSVIFIDEDNDMETPNIFIGMTALSKGKDIPSHMISSSKTHMGDINFTYPCAKEGHTFKKKLTPEDVAFYILRKVRQTLIERGICTPDKTIPAVITHPAYFPPAACHATIRAAERAGFQVRTLEEPYAAAYAYFNKYTIETTQFCVVDFGGGTLDLTCMRQGDDGNYHVIGTGSGTDSIAGRHTNLGGDDFDKYLTKWLAGKPCNETGQSLIALHRSGAIDDQTYHENIRHFCRIAKKAKEDLFQQHVSHSGGRLQEIQIQTRLNGRDFTLQCSLSEKEFNEICKEIYDNFTNSMKKMLDDTRKNCPDFNPQETGNVFLAGGTCKITKVRELIKEFFPKATIEIDDLAGVVSHGAAVDASMQNILPKLTFDWGVEILDANKKVFFPVITRNDRPGCSKSAGEYTTNLQNPDIINVGILSRDAIRYGMEENELEKCQKWAVLNITEFQAGYGGKPKIEIFFHYSKEGIVSVFAKDKISGKEKQCTINPLKPDDCPPPEEIPLQLFDIFLLVDVSNSMNGEITFQGKVLFTRLQKVRDTVCSLTEEIIPDMSRFRIGIYPFGEKDAGEPACLLTNSKEQICSTINELAEQYGKKGADASYCASVLENTAQLLSGSQAEDREPVIILLTDGVFTDKEDVESASTRIKSDGIDIITVGIGCSISEGGKIDFEYIKKLSSVNPDGTPKSYLVKDVTKLKEIFGKIIANLTRLD